MEKNPFLQMLDKFQRLNKEQSELADLVQWSFKASDTKAAYDLSLRLEELTERSVLLSRSLPAYTGNPRSVHDVEAVIGREIPVEIGFTEEGCSSQNAPVAPEEGARLCKLYPFYCVPCDGGILPGQATGTIPGLCADLPTLVFPE